MSEGFLTKRFLSQEVKPGEPLFLSMFLGKQSFQYSISTNGFKNVVELCDEHFVGHAFHWNDAINFFVKNHQLQLKHFEKVNIVLLNNDFTMTPEAFVQESEIRKILHFTTGASNTASLIQHHVQNARFSFTVESELLSCLEKTFPQACIRHSVAISLHQLFNNHSLVNSEVFLNIGEHFIELAARNKSDVLFYNVFDFENNEDVLYYLLFMMEQFNLNPLLVRLRLAGQRAADDDLIKSIKKYVKQVDFGAHDPALNFSDEIKKLPSHYYFTLFNQQLCEL